MIWELTITDQRGNVAIYTHSSKAALEQIVSDLHVKADSKIEIKQVNKYQKLI